MENNNYVPFVSEVEEFNALMNKPNNYEPTIPTNKNKVQIAITSELVTSMWYIVATIKK